MSLWLYAFFKFFLPPSLSNHTTALLTSSGLPNRFATRVNNVMDRRKNRNRNSISELHSIKILKRLHKSILLLYTHLVEMVTLYPQIDLPKIAISQINVLK